MNNRVDSAPPAGTSRPYHFPSDQMGNSHMQFEVLRVLVGLLIDFFSHAQRLYRIGGELNFFLDPGDLSRKVVPDMYILEDEPQGGPKVPAWKPWEHGGKVPTVALEVVSDAYTKDYKPEEIPARYEQLGVRELVRYDPDFSGHKRSKYPRSLLSHFVRDDKGKLVEQPVSGEAVGLRTYPFWLVHQAPYYLRLATGAGVESLILRPTDAERAQQEKERARGALEEARKETERAQAETERANQAEAEVERLRAELARLRGER